MIIIGRLGSKYALRRLRWPYIEVDLDDMLSANMLFGIIGRDGALQLHLPSAKSPIHYAEVSQTPISLSKMGNSILNRNQTRWGDTDARLIPKAFREPARNCQTDIREMLGGGAQ